MPRQFLINTKSKVIALGLILLFSAFLLSETLMMPQPPIYSVVGPSFMPLVLSLALMALAVFGLLGVALAHFKAKKYPEVLPQSDAVLQVSYAKLIIILLGTVIFLLLLSVFGFILASIFLIGLSVRLLGVQLQTRTWFAVTLMVLVTWGIFSLLGLRLGSLFGLFA